MRILIAEDDRMSALMLSRTLEAWGYQVSVTPDGEAAWASITGAEPPSLVIADWMMPRVDGIQLCRRIRATPPAAPIYIILLTARNSRQDLVAGLEAGADDYLTKPFDPDELRARVRVGERTIGLLVAVKRLSGLLPICSYCKRIRTDQDYWEQLEQYLSEHTDVRLSHGICPSCLEKALAEIDTSPDPALSARR